MQALPLRQGPSILFGLWEGWWAAAYLSADSACTGQSMTRHAAHRGRFSIIPTETYQHDNRVLRSA